MHRYVYYLNIKECQDTVDNIFRVVPSSWSNNKETERVEVVIDSKEICEKLKQEGKLTYNNSPMSELCYDAILHIYTMHEGVLHLVLVNHAWVNETMDKLRFYYTYINEHIPKRIIQGVKTLERNFKIDSLINEE